MVLQRPFFEVEVELSVPNIQMIPALEDIQSAVNRAALHILRYAPRAAHRTHAARSL